MPFYFFKKEVFEEEEKPYQELEPSPTSLTWIALRTVHPIGFLCVKKTQKSRVQKSAVKTCHQPPNK